MSARLELAVRGALRGVASRIGTAPVSLSLLALAALYLGAWIAWGRLGTPEGAHALVTSYAFGALAAALVIDAAVALTRVLPLEITPEGRVHLLAGRGSLAAALVRGGQALIALAFVASLLSRDRLELRVAEGEEFTGAPEQFAGRDPPRRMSPGPFPIAFTVEQVEARLGQDGGVDRARATIDVKGGGRERVGGAWPLWRGWGRFLLAEDAGLALRWELARKSGTVIDTAIVKLDLLPPGKIDGLRLAGAPHRVYVELLAAPLRGPPAVPPLRASVYRGKLLVAQGDVAPGGEIEFEGLVLRFPEARGWVALGMVRDVGIPLAMLGAALAALGLAVGRFASRRSSST